MPRVVSKSVASTAPEGVRSRDPMQGRMPIEELARLTAMTVRNLRALHARGILQPPELTGRKGFYTERHVARVLLISKLQGRGFSLAAIEALVASWQAGGGLVELMGLEDAIVDPGAEGVAVEVDVVDALPALLQSTRALEMAIDQGLVVARDGRYVAPNAELLGIVKQQVAEGFPLEALLEDGEALIADVARIGTRLRESFFRYMVKPHFDAGAPVSALPEIAAKVERLRPLAVRLMSILLARELARGGGPNGVAPSPVPVPSVDTGPTKKPGRRAPKANKKPAPSRKTKRSTRSRA